MEEFMQKGFRDAGYVTLPWRGYLYSPEGIKLAVELIVRFLSENK